MWEQIIVNPFTNVLLMIYKLIGGNFGVAIILFTILIRLITHPLMVSQIKGSTKMQELQSSKEWLDIQKKYKGDKEKLAQEQMKYYKEIGYNPLVLLPAIRDPDSLDLWSVPEHHAGAGFLTYAVAYPDAHYLPLLPHCRPGAAQ